MVVGVIACGQSSEGWFNTQHDHTIGVNDCFKFGHPVNQLLLINSPNQFEKSRLETIKTTKFDKVLTHSGTWDKIFPQAEKIRMQSFSKHLKKGHVYSSKTSPFVALSLAFNLGATDVILHGVDLVSHPAIKDKLLNYELRQFANFIRLLNEQGTRVYLAKKYGMLQNVLPVWDPLKAIEGE